MSLVNPRQNFPNKFVSFHQGAGINVRPDIRRMMPIRNPAVRPVVDDGQTFQTRHLKIEKPVSQQHQKHGKNERPLGGTDTFKSIPLRLETEADKRFMAIIVRQLFLCGATPAWAEDFSEVLKMLEKSQVYTLKFMEKKAWKISAEVLYF